MSHQPIVSFLSSSLLGKKPFPLDRLNNRIPLSQNDFSTPEKSPWTYQKYFQALQEVLAKNSYGLLLEAVKRQLFLPIRLKEVQRILLYSEKHGNWYHPAKVEVITPHVYARFVLNVALTERGQAVMSQEIRALKYLADNFSYSWLPTVYYYDESVMISPSGYEIQAMPISLFMADWFEGFHEFHLSVDPADGLVKLILWDGQPKPNYLTSLQTRQVYRQISKILTLCYNPRTYDQIFPWHHGAGDFVAKLDGDRVEVRIVTVRQYGPLADPEDMEAFDALLFFFLNLSLRMRLDRLDGVGEIIWAEGDCLESTWEGFLEAIWIKEKEEAPFPGFLKTFLKEISRFSKEEITERFEALLASYTPEAPDLPVIKKNMVSHINLVHKTIQSFGR